MTIVGNEGPVWHSLIVFDRVIILEPIENASVFKHPFVYSF